MKWMQVEILNRVRRRGHYFLCHICTPSFKKGVRQLDQQRVEYPSAFLVQAIKFIEGGVGSRMNKLALLKAIVCLLSTVDLASRKRVFHPLRRKEHEVLELVIVFFRRALQEEGSNFHVVRELWCPLQVRFGFLYACLGSCYIRFLLYKTRSYKGLISKILSFYASLLQVNIFVRLNHTN